MKKEKIIKISKSQIKVDSEIIIKNDDLYLNISSYMEGIEYKKIKIENIIFYINMIDFKYVAEYSSTLKNNGGFKLKGKKK